MSQISFEQSSYLAQVRRLRALAESVLTQYPIRVEKFEFINHGENTTFRVYGGDGQSYLLRIQRPNYHTRQAVLEEVRWLDRVARQTDIQVPRPLRSKKGRWVESGQASGVSSARDCVVFKWVAGQFIRRSLAPKHLYQVGRVLAVLQQNGRGHKSVHRDYWVASGLVGSETKFGSLDQLFMATSCQQAVITAARKKTLAILRRFESKYPQRTGLIHADLHFGNILRTAAGEIAAIDFDDCGRGFYAYDLVIPLISSENILESCGQLNQMPRYRQALIEGYSSLASWDQHDDKVLDSLVTARRLLMLGWFNSRSDNPRLRAYAKKALARTLKYLNMPS